MFVCCVALCASPEEYYNPDVPDEELGTQWEQAKLKLLPTTVASLVACRGAEAKKMDIMDLQTVDQVKKLKEELLRTAGAVKTLRLSVLHSAKELQKAMDVAKSREEKKKQQEAVAAEKAANKKAFAEARSAAKKAAAPSAGLPPRMVGETLFQLKWVESPIKDYITDVPTKHKKDPAPLPLYKMEANTTGVGIETFCNEEPSVQRYLANFVQQAPAQPSTIANGRAIGPIKNTLQFAAQLRHFLRESAPNANELNEAETQSACGVAAYWNLSNMQLCYAERSMSPTIRYQYRGTSEMLIFQLADLLAHFGKNVNMQTELYKKVQDFSNQGLEEFAKVAKPAHVLLLPGEVLVLPAAAVVAERAVGGKVSYGFRLPFLSPPQKDVFLATLEHVAAAFPKHPHMPQMQAMRTAYG